MAIWLLRETNVYLFGNSVSIHLLFMLKIERILTFRFTFTRSAHPSKVPLMNAFTGPGPDPSPTVLIYLRVPVPLASGGWAWGESEAYRGALAREYAYTAHEVRSLVHSYGRILKEAAHVSGRRAALGERFSIVAKGRVTGLTVGLREWEWSRPERAYVRTGEYLDGWRQAVRAYWQQTGTLLSSLSFDASLLATGGIPILRLPQGTKEDAA
ncbi:hypothetical protein ACWEQ3_01355 [Streptomyces mirabilis]